MPKEKGDKMAITIWVDKTLAKKAESLAEKAGITRSKFLANVIEVGIEEIEWADKVGMWALARVFRDFREKIRDGIRKGVADEKSKIVS